MLKPVRLRSGKMLFKWDAEKRILCIKRHRLEATLRLNDGGEFEVVGDSYAGEEEPRGELKT